MLRSKGEGVWESVTVCDRGGGIRSCDVVYTFNFFHNSQFYVIFHIYHAFLRYISYLSCILHNTNLTVIRPVFPFGNIRFQLKLRNYAGGLRLNKKIEICIWSHISKFLRPAQRYDDFKLIILNMASRKTAVVLLAGVFKQTSKTAVVLLAGVTISQNCCRPTCRCHHLAKLLSSYPSRVLRAPGTSSYHLVPKHLRATWPRPEQSHLLPEACSPDGTDKRRQRQRRTERPPPEPSNILKRFCALYDVEIRYYKKKVSKIILLV